MRKEVVAAAFTTAATIVGVAAILTHWKKKSQLQWMQTQRILRKFSRECATPVPHLWTIADSFVADIESSPSPSCVVSYISPLPTGDENGLYYGINLKVSSFLILKAKLLGKNEWMSLLQREEIPIPCNIMSATSEELFEFIASSLANFILKHTDDTLGTENKLGFTISHPVEQSVISHNNIALERFSSDDPVGKQYVNEINQALQKHGINMHVFALVDDLVGELAGGRYYNKECVLSVNLGMSSANATYIDDSGDKAINVDWGNFNSTHLPVTEFDYSLDVESSNPGRQKFVKLISGMYLGEIVRLVLLKMAKETALFGDKVPPKLKTPYLLRSPDMAAIHQDTSDNHQVVDEKLNNIFGISYTTPMVREVVAEICDIVSERGARLAGAGIVGILKKLGRIESKRSVVTIEGGVYEHYRVFRNYIHSSVWEMLGDDLSDNIVLEHSHGAGAIFMAAKNDYFRNR